MTNFKEAMIEAAYKGNLDLVLKCKKWCKFNNANILTIATQRGHMNIVLKCKERCANDFNRAMDIVLKCKEPNNFNDVMEIAAKYGHMDIVLKCKEWDFEAIHNDLFQWHHKRKFHKNIDAELGVVVMHPDRVVDWYFDEAQKKDLKKLWGET